MKKLTFKIIEFVRTQYKCMYNVHVQCSTNYKKHKQIDLLMFIKY